MESKREWIYGIWFVPGGDQDYLATLKKTDDGPWTLDYRFRYYSPLSKSPHDNLDRKSCYTARMKDGSQESLAKSLECQRAIIAHVEARLGGQHDFVDLQCYDNDPKMFFELGSRDWAHIRLEGDHGRTA